MRTRRWFGGMVLVGACAAALALPALGQATEYPQPPTSFEPVLEAENFAITQERQAIYDTPEYQSQLLQLGTQSNLEALETQARDPGRFFTNNVCWNRQNGCAGDIRLNGWEANGDGISQPVLFTARNGATLSGRLWATRGGPKRRAGIVITNGSVQADEQLYWFEAQTLAKAGYVVLTFDPQGQGQSDTLGQAPDELEGVPSQTDGRPFFDGTEDAIDFFLSTPKHPYEPVASCETGTSHAAKQNERVTAGLDAAYDPLWNMLKPKQLGLLGHSYGAAGVSYIGQWDPRVSAVVALDNLGGPSPGGGELPGSGGKGSIGEKECPADPAERTTAPISKPALGISADYGLPPTPNTSLPDPHAKSAESLAYSAAGVDSGEIVIRGGSHLDFSFIPNQAFGASLRGPDMTAWYTTAWFDKYVRHRSYADKELTTTRWRDDAEGASADPRHDANLFSFYYYSRLDFHLRNGTTWDCEDLREGCSGMTPAGRDHFHGNYSYVDVDTKPE